LLFPHLIQGGATFVPKKSPSTDIYIAAGNGDAAAVRQFLRDGVDVNKRDSNGVCREKERAIFANICLFFRIYPSSGMMMMSEVGMLFDDW
jgi:hypothetical protein